jgi:hypothetical protein
MAAVTTETSEVIILEETTTSDFSIAEALAAYMWAHHSDPNCTQLTKSATTIEFKIDEPLPDMVHSIFGATISMHETAQILSDGNFESECVGTLPQAIVRAQMTFTSSGNNTSIRTLVALTWKTEVTDFVKRGVSAFIAGKTQKYRDDLATNLKIYKSKQQK